MKGVVMLALLYSAQLVLSKPVDVSNSRSYITATKGERFILPCGIAQAANCQWTKDGFGLGTQQDLPGWPRYSLGEECDLVIDPVLPIDEGTYQCQGGGNSGENVVVTVVAQPGPPHIEQAKHGDVIEVLEDEEVTLDCESKGGRPEAELDWSYGNMKVMEKDWSYGNIKVMKKVIRLEDLHTDPGPQSDQERKTFKTISTLRFTAKEDAAITCSAFSEDFPTPRTSSPLHVKVKYRPKVEMKFSQEKLKEGDNLEVECLVKAYPDDVTYKWFVDDVEEDGFNGNKFKMKKLTRMHHKSNIKCLVENQVGKAEVVKSLNVEFGPKMLIQPTTVNAKAGDKVTFTCKALANPEPTYVWVKGTSSSSPEVVGAGEELPVVASDETETDYICKVVSLGFPMISTAPAQLVIEKDSGVSVDREPRVLPDVVVARGVSVDREPRVLPDLEEAEPTEAPMLPIVSNSKSSKDSFTKVLQSFKKDYVLFQKRTQKYMKQSDKYFIDSNRFEKKYKTFKKKVKKFPKSFRKFLQTADIV